MYSHWDYRDCFENVHTERLFDQPRAFRTRNVHLQFDLLLTQTKQEGGLLDAEGKLCRLAVAAAPPGGG
jgi:hypothetical protein